MNEPLFRPFPKIGRLSRDMIVTEKLDGTNACIHIPEVGPWMVGSRTRWITPQDDNFGFAAWVRDNALELSKLGIGTHFGEWWGSGIQRKYSLQEKRFSLFNVSRWNKENKPHCCHVVPSLYIGDFSTLTITGVMDELRQNGSHAAPGFMDPEGVVIFHTQSGAMFKKTFEKDDAGKGREPALEIAAQ
jgi:hypothetical protein